MVAIACYKAKLRELVESKVAGKEIVAPPAAKHVQVLSLIDALKRSVAEVQGEAQTEADRPPKKVAPSTPTKPARKRKSS